MRPTGGAKLRHECNSYPRGSTSSEGQKPISLARIRLTHRQALFTMHATTSTAIRPAPTACWRPADVVRARRRARGRRSCADRPRRSLPASPKRARRRGGGDRRSSAASELSVSWEDDTIHVVALRIDPDNADARQRASRRSASGRDARARRIGDALADAGIPERYEGALKYVTSERLISRTHFARFLVDSGHARDMKDVVQALPACRASPATSRTCGRRSTQVVGLDPRGGRAGGDRASGTLQGDAARIARAARRISRSGRRCDRGASRRRIRRRSTPSSPRCAASSGCKASCGSDFHGPGESRMDFGDLPPLPAGVDPGLERLVAHARCRRARLTRTADARSPHRFLHFRPHRHHGGDVRQQPAVAIRGSVHFHRRDDSVRRLAGEGRRRRAAGQRDGRARGPAADRRSARSSTRR